MIPVKFATQSVPGSECIFHRGDIVNAQNVRVLLCQSNGNTDGPGESFFDRATNDLAKEAFSGMTDQHWMTGGVE